MISDYQDTVDSAGRHARTAIPLATQHKLPVNPIVYTVFYQHVAKMNLPLSNALTEILETEQVSEDAVKALYNEYVYLDQVDALSSLRGALDELFGSARSTLQEAGSETKEYAECLESATVNLNAATSTESIQSIVSSLISQTENMRLKAESLDKELSDARAQMHQMQRQYEQAKHESLTDPLTGLSNRRAFDEKLVELCRDSGEQQSPLSLLALDLDYFKKINDTHGHDVGDIVLKWAAKVFAGLVGEKDLPARVGGEEFAILLPKTDIRQAENVAEKIRKTIANKILKRADLVLGQTTVSIGVSQYDVRKDVSTFIKRADEALYAAKQQGRNRVVSFA